MKGFSIQEFRPTIVFLARFIGLYLAANFLYGLYVTSYEPQADPATRWVTGQTAMVLDVLGWPVTIADHSVEPTTMILHNGKPSLLVYEGCNGLNIVVVFLSFIFAFGPFSRSLLWFVPIGIGVIHVANIVRVLSLFFVSEYHPDYLYFFHKFLFTGVLYLIVFLLWLWWLKAFNSK